MFCQSCGMEVASTYKFCPKCGGHNLGPGRPAAASAQPAATPPQQTYVAPQPQQQPRAAAPIYAANMAYAGFWRRFVASIVDGLLVQMVQFLWLLPMKISSDNDSTLGGEVFVSFGIFILNLLYFGLMESSPWQATLGKRWLGLKVVDESGQRITFSRALGRSLGKILSFVLLGIGYLMVIWTKRKQGLHDKMAGTCVIHVGR